MWNASGSSGRSKTKGSLKMDFKIRGSWWTRIDLSHFYCRLLDQVFTALPVLQVLVQSVILMVEIPVYSGSQSSDKLENAFRFISQGCILCISGNILYRLIWSIYDPLIMNSSLVGFQFCYICLQVVWTVTP